MSKDSSLPPGNSSDAEDAEGFAADADEVAAASALARALEGRSTAGAPDSALETAALLRYSSAAGELSNERRAALREQVLASVPAVSPRSDSVGAGSPRQRFWRWFGLVMPLAGAAAALWLVVGAFRQAAEPELSRLADSHTAQSAAPAEGAAAPGGEQATHDTAAENTAADETAQDTAASDRALRAATAPEAEAAPSALAYRMAAPSPAAKAGPASEERGSGAGLGAAEAKRAAAPSAASTGASGAASSERLERASQRYRSRLLPRLGDARVDQAYAALDGARTSAELRQAQTNLTALSSGALGSAADSADADVLRQDIFCRLAEVALRLGQPDAALDWARRGLELLAPPNPFAARLWHVQGKAKAALGDQDGAARSYLQAIEVNEQLLDESLDGSE